jgi:hypothetical protein
LVVVRSVKQVKVDNWKSILNEIEGRFGSECREEIDLQYRSPNFIQGTTGKPRGSEGEAKGKRRGSELGESGSAIFGSGCARPTRILNLKKAAN